MVSSDPIPKVNNVNYLLIKGNDDAANVMSHLCDPKMLKNFAEKENELKKILEKIRLFINKFQ